MSVMVAPLTFGRHRASHEGDLVRVQIVGDFDRENSVAFHDYLTRVIDEQGRLFIIGDLHGAGGIDAAARTVSSEWNRAHKLSACACFGASFPVRVLLTLTMNAVKVLGFNDIAFAFVKDEPEARRWIDVQRAGLFPA
jgi:hypothetical protein